MRVLGISHVGLAASDVTKAAWFFGTVLGLKNVGNELVAEQQTMTIMFTAHSDEGGTADSRLEILEPKGADGPIAKFLAKRGSGLHHLALIVANLDEALLHLAGFGVEMIDKVPRGGAHKTRIAFVHPRATGGLLVELVEELS